MYFNKNYKDVPVIKLSSINQKNLNNEEIKIFLNEMKWKFNIINYNEAKDFQFIINFSNFISLMNFIFFIKNENYFKFNFLKDEDLVNYKKGLFSIKNENDVIERPINKIIKFTGKFYISKNVNKNYPISKKIIGIKGINMKKILNNLRSNQLPCVKLRLRGKGSGFKEGLEKKESNENLHLCISTENKKVFYIALNLIENLLIKIQKEYIKFYKFPTQIYQKYIEVFK